MEEMKKIMLIGTVAVLSGVSGCYYTGPCVQGYGPVTTEERYLEDFTGVSNTGSFDVRISRADTFGVAVEAQENLIGLIETYVSGSHLIVKTRNGSCISSPVPVIVHVDMPEIREIGNSGSGSLTADVAETEDFDMANTGSGLISIESITAATASLRNSGSGELHVDGSDVAELYISQTGSGLVDAGFIYGAPELTINHTSSGEVAATLLDGYAVDARLTGSGKILLDGDAVDAGYVLSSSGKIDALDLMVAEADVRITGSGKVYVHATEFLDVTITSSGDVLYLGNPNINSTITGSGSIRKYN